MTSALRLIFLKSLGDTRNPTWDFWKLAFWSAVEMYTSIICACLPAAKATGDYVLKQWWERLDPSITDWLGKPKLPWLNPLKRRSTSGSSTHKLEHSASSQRVITARTSVTVSTMQEDHEKGFPDLPEWEIGVDGGTRSGRLCMTVVAGNVEGQARSAWLTPTVSKETC